MSTENGKNKKGCGCLSTIVGLFVILYLFASCGGDDTAGTSESVGSASTAIETVQDVGSAADDTTGKPAEETSEESAEEPEKELNDNLLLNVGVRETSLVNGFGEEIDGTRGYIEFDKDSAQNDVSEKDFVEFYKTAVKDSALNYVTIDFSDGTGIVFIPGIRSAEYCEIDDTGSNINAIGYITWNKNKVTYQTAEEVEAEEAAESAEEEK